MGKSSLVSATAIAQKKNKKQIQKGVEKHDVYHTRKTQSNAIRVAHDARHVWEGSKGSRAWRGYNLDELLRFIIDFATSSNSDTALNTLFAVLLTNADGSVPMGSTWTMRHTRDALGEVSDGEKTYAEMMTRPRMVFSLSGHFG